MIVIVKLRHKTQIIPGTKNAREAKVDIWGLNASEISRILQLDNKHKQAILEAYVQTEIRLRMPQTYSAFDVVSWEFSDHSEDALKQIFREKRGTNAILPAREASSLAPFI